jgi:hypothetical protein
VQAEHSFWATGHRWQHGSHLDPFAHVRVNRPGAGRSHSSGAPVTLKCASVKISMAQNPEWCILPGSLAARRDLLIGVIS